MTVATSTSSSSTRIDAVGGLHGNPPKKKKIKKRPAPAANRQLSHLKFPSVGTRGNFFFVLLFYFPSYFAEFRSVELEHSIRLNILLFY